MRIIKPQVTNLTGFSPIRKGGIAAQLEKTGQLPPITIQIIPLEGRPFKIDRFIEYSFNSSMIIPVDTFNFSFVAPDDPRPMNQIIKDGDLVRIYANGVALATGIIDQTSVETDSEFGERGSISGRTLLAQLEDQDVVNSNASPIYGSQMTVEQVVNALIQDTRIPGLVTRGATTKPWLFATEPGESKLAALQRYLEPLNLLVNNDEFGRIVIAKPKMNQVSSGIFFCLKSQRRSNVKDIKCLRSATVIPNEVLPIWSGQEQVLNRISKEQIVKNAAPRPSRLNQRGHILRKSVVVSTPQGSTAQDLSAVNQLKIAASNLLQAYAKREIARANQKEVIVQVVVPGHFNDSGERYHVDHLYRIQYDRGDVDEEMYCFQVEYSGGDEKGQTTSLYFCRKGTIVADISTGPLATEVSQLQTAANTRSTT